MDERAVNEKVIKFQGEAIRKDGQPLKWEEK